MKIYVGNLSYEVTEDDLREALGQFGKVDSATIIKDKYSGQSKGFGFVELSSKAEGQAAIDGLNGKELKGRTVTVNEALPRTENRAGKGGYGGAKSGGGGREGGYGGKSGGGGREGGYGGKGGGNSRGGGGYSGAKSGGGGRGGSGSGRGGSSGSGGRGGQGRG